MGPRPAAAVLARRPIVMSSDASQPRPSAAGASPCTRSFSPAERAKPQHKPLGQSPLVGRIPRLPTIQEPKDGHVCSRRILPPTELNPSRGGGRGGRSSWRRRGWSNEVASWFPARHGRRLFAGGALPRWQTRNRGSGGCPGPCLRQAHQSGFTIPP